VFHTRHLRIGRAAYGRRRGTLALVDREALVVFGKDGIRMPGLLATELRVVQLMPPRLAIVSGDDQALSLLGDAAEVRALVRAGDAAGTIDDLGPDEQLFVAAWSERQIPKVRRGDGLTWDAPELEPPDWPQDRRPL
jgi:hypothetical protein